MSIADHLPECVCRHCGWIGLWDDVCSDILYAETHQDPMEVRHACPLCGDDVDTFNDKEDTEDEY
jgi:hypothetical protein